MIVPAGSGFSGDEKRNMECYQETYTLIILILLITQEIPRNSYLGHMFLLILCPTLHSE